MPLYRISTRSGNTGAAAASAEFRAVGSVVVREIHITVAGATSSAFGIGRPANVPAGGTVLLGQASGPDDAVTAAGLVIAAWGTAPTAPTVFMDRWTSAATIGERVVLPYRHLVVSGGSLVVWNFAIVAASDITFVFEG